MSRIMPIGAPIAVSHSPAVFISAAGEQTNPVVGALTVPKGARNGQWTLRVRLVDATRGVSGYNPSSSAWVANGWPRSFTVVSIPDLKRPSLLTLSLSRAFVDTQKAPKTIAVTATMADNLSGVAALTVTVQASAGHTHREMLPLHLIRGTLVRGTWKGVVHVPTWAGGTHRRWDILSFDGLDRAGNRIYLSGAQLEGAHRVRSFLVTSRTDHTRPTFTSVSFTPTSVNALAANQTVQVTAHLRASYSGTVSARVMFSSASGARATAFLRRSAGSAHNGTWTGMATIRRCSDPGTWVVSNVYAADGATNRTNLNAQQVAALIHPAILSVQSIDATPPQFSVPTWVPREGPLVVTFSEATLWADGSVSSPPLQVMDWTDRWNPVFVGGAWSCKNASAATVVCDADGADVTTANFIPTTPFPIGHSYVVDAGSGIYDLVGNGPISTRSGFSTR